MRLGPNSATAQRWWQVEGHQLFSCNAHIKEHGNHSKWQLKLHSGMLSCSQRRPRSLQAPEIQKTHVFMKGCSLKQSWTFFLRILV